MQADQSGSKPSHQRLILLGIVAAIAGVLGDRLLRPLPGAAIVGILLVAIAGLIWLVRSRPRSASSETLGQVLVVALLSTTAGHGASRLPLAGALVVLVGVVAGAIAVLLVVSRSRKKVTAPGTAAPGVAAPTGSSRQRR